MLLPRRLKAVLRPRQIHAEGQAPPIASFGAAMSARCDEQVFSDSKGLSEHEGLISSFLSDFSWQNLYHAAPGCGYTVTRSAVQSPLSYMPGQVNLEPR